MGVSPSSERRAATAAAAVALLLTGAALAGCGSLAADQQRVTAAAPTTPGSDAEPTSTGSPAVAGDDAYLAPVVVVTCTDQGTLVKTPKVAAQRDGVHLLVTDATGDSTAYVNWGIVQADGTVQLYGGDPAPAETVERVVGAQPGQMVVGCSHQTGAFDDPQVRVAVADPHGYYRDADVPKLLGCEPTHGIADGTTAYAPTPTGAVARLVGDLPGNPAISPGPGYAQADNLEFVVVSDSTRAVVGAWREPRPGGDGARWGASVKMYC